MISKSPEQELYDAAMAVFMQSGHEVYPHSPPEGTKMPYIRMGYTQVIPDSTKTMLLANGYLAFDVWGLGDDRGSVSALVLDLMQKLSAVKHTESFGTEMNMQDSTYEILPDQSTSTDLWQGRVTTKWRIKAR